MKGTVNKMILLGRLGQDPEVRATASGTTVVNLNVATNELGPKDQSGARQDLTEWHRVVLFGKTADIAAQYLKKGGLVYIEGRLQTRKWQDQSGADRYSTEIVGYEMQLMGGKQDNQQPQQNYQPKRPANPNQPQSGNYTQSPQPQQNQPVEQQPQNQQVHNGHNTNYNNQPNPANHPPKQPPPQAGGFDEFDDLPF